MAHTLAAFDPVRAALLRAAALAVHSNLFIAAAATGVAASTVRLVGLPLEAVPLGIVFAAALFVYSLNRITDLEEDRRNLPGRAAFTERYGRVLFAAGAALYLVVVAWGLWAGVRGAPFLLLPAVVAGLYSRVGLKGVLGVKNALVGISWGIIPLGVGVYYGIWLTRGIVFLSAFFTVMLTVAAALFDIKDIEGDRAAGVRTIPIVAGPAATRKGALAVTALVAVAVLAAVAVGWLPPRYLTLCAFLGYVAAYTPFATTGKGPLFYGFVIDGEHLFLTAVVFAVL